MSDLVEMLREHAHQADDSGRFGWCDSMTEAADRIEQLEAALRVFTCDCTINERCAVPDNCRNFQARRTLEERT